MKTTKDIYEEMEELVRLIDGEDAAEEVKVEFVAYETNTNLLLDSKDIDEYLQKYTKIYEEDIALLECFNSTTAEDLKNHLEQNNITFDDLKIETVNASCEALKFLIYEAEDEEYG